MTAGDPLFDLVLAFSRRLRRARGERHHGGASTPKPACSSTGAPFAEKRQHAGRVDRLLRRRRGGQGRAERRDDPGRQSQAAQEVLVGVHHVALQTRSARGRPPTRPLR